MIKLCRCQRYLGQIAPFADTRTVRGLCITCRRELLPRVMPGETMTFVTGVRGMETCTLDNRRMN